MEDKQLDFNRPFLSVRRNFTPTAASSGAEDKRKINSSLPDRSHLPLHKSEIISGPLRNPGTVPFTWEKTPGRPKNEGHPPNKGQERPPSAPKLPPGRPLASGEDHDNLETEHGTSKDKTHEAAASSIVEDDDEAYFEAQDILSRSESFFFNCSISGLSGLDGPDPTLSGRFSTDPHVQNFMMGRFLPAAKAMASETPPHPPPKKQPAVQEQQPRVVKKAVNVNQQHPLYQYRPGGVSPQYAPEALAMQGEDDEFEHESSSVKVCGLLPRFLVKSSFCILDPVQGLGMQERHISSARRVHAKSSNSTIRGESGEKHGSDVIREQIHARRYKASDKSKSTDSDRITGKRDPRRLHDPSEHKNPLQTGSSSNKIGSSRSETSKGKGCLSFRELLASEGEEWKSSNSGPMVERTLYIDSVHTKSVTSETCSVSNNTEEHSSNGSVFLELNGLDYKKKEAAFLDPLPRDIKVINVVEEAALFDSACLDVKEIVVVEEKEEIEGLQNAESVHLGLIGNGLQTRNESHSHLELICNGNRFKNNQAAAQEKINNTREIEMALTPSKQEDLCGDFSNFLVPPPLPKSPSESWLFRTLPTISSKNASTRPLMGLQQECDRIPKSPSTEPPKWEAIVKSSNAYHHQFFPQELLEPIPES